MSGLSSTLIPFDSEIEKTTRAIRRANRAAQLAKEKLKKEKTHVSSDNESGQEKLYMEISPR